MRRMEIVVIAILVGVSLGSGCQSAPKPAPKPTLLPVPGGTNTVAARHSDEGIQAYQQGQWAGAQQHFEAAIQASPELAEAHYNLGMTLYRIGAIAEGNSHFIKAADLAPTCTATDRSDDAPGIDFSSSRGSVSSAALGHF
nr:tetratricopeptide repeat protein [Nitrospirota bacterium]